MQSRCGVLNSVVNHTTLPLCPALLNGLLNAGSLQLVLVYHSLAIVYFAEHTARQCFAWLEWMIWFDKRRLYTAMFRYLPVLFVICCAVRP
jgi:hypothetical protein